MGVRGQKCLISGNHMVRTWRRELGLAREKQSTTTSDLKGWREQGWKEYQWSLKRQKERRADLLCHEQKMPVIRRHVVFDGIKETEIKKGNEKDRCWFNGRLVKFMLKTYMCGWSFFELLQGTAGAWTVPVRKLGSEDVCARVGLCVCDSGPLGCWFVWPAPLSLSLSPALSYVNLHKPFKATWTTKRKLRIDQNTHTHTHGISFSPFLMCLSRQTAALTAVLQSWNFCDMLVRVFLLLGNVWLSFVPAGWII